VKVASRVHYWLLFILLFLVSAGNCLAESRISLSDKEKEWIAAHPVVQLGFSSTMEPLLIKSGSTFTGIYGDLFKELEQQIGITFKIVDTPWNQTVARVRSGELDGFLACTAQQAQASNLFMSNPISSISSSIFVVDKPGLQITNFHDLANKKIAVLKEGQATLSLLNDLHLTDKIKLVEVESSLVGFQLLTEGKVDAVVGMNFDLYSAIKHSMFGIKIAHVDFNRAQHIFTAIRKDWPELVALVNKGLEAVGYARINDIHAQWMGVQPQGNNFPIPLSEQEKRWLEKKESLEVVLDRNSMPYAFINARGEFTGIVSDVLKTITMSTGMDFTYTPVEYERVVEHVRNAKTPVITCFDPPDYPEYEQHYFTSREIAFMPFGLFARNDALFKNFSLHNLQGKRIALVKGWSTEHPALQEYQDSVFLFRDNYMDCIDAVLSGEADAMFDVAPLVTFLLDQQMISGIGLIKVSRFGQPLHILVHKDYPEAFSVIDKVISSLDQDKRNLLLRKWRVSLSSPSYRLLTVELTDAEREWLLRNPVIRVGNDPNFQPIEWRDENGNAHGLSIDYLKNIGELLGVQFEFIPYNSWEDLFKAAESKEIELLGAIAATPKRAAQFNFTSSYIDLKPKIFIAEKTGSFVTLGELAGQKVAIVKGHAVTEHLKQDYPEIEIIEAQTLRQAIEKVQSGDAYAMIGSMLATRHTLKEMGLTNIIVGGDTPYTFPLSFGIRKELPMLHSIMEKALGILPMETRDHIYQKWAPIQSNKLDRSMIWKVAFPLLFLLMLVLGWIWSLRNQVNRRTRDLQQATENLQKTTSKLQEAEKIALLGHWEYNHHSRTILWSMQAGSMLTKGAQTAPDNLDAYLNLVHPEERKRVANILEKAVPTPQEWETSHRLILEDGEVKYVQFKGRTEFDKNENELVSFGTIQDITGQKLMEEKVHQSDKLKALGQLAGGVAHDFNNVLTGISGATEILHTQLDSSPKSEPFYDIIFKAIDQAAGLTQQLLSFSRNKSITVDNVDMHSVIHDAAALLERTLDKSITITLKLAATDSNVVGDPHQLQNILINMGINAGHAMPEGGELSIRTRVVPTDEAAIWANELNTNAPTCIELTVQDTGCGIPARELPRIFEPFFTTRKEGEGTGLGLSAVYGTVQQHQGDVKVQSTVGAGTTFTIVLPLSRMAAAPVDQTDEDIYQGKGTILIVDDEYMTRATTSAMLEKTGYRTLLAENGKQAVKLFKQNKDEIDLVLLDMNMPVMSGQDCFHALQALSPTVRVILTSGYTRDENVYRLCKEGVATFIQKPFTRHHLCSTIHAHVMG